MPLFIKNDAAILFMHVPKAGGTTVQELFRQSGYSVELVDHGGRGSLNPFLRCSPQHWHAQPVLEVLVPEKLAASFLVSRHPLSRFKSEFRWRVGKAVDGSARQFEAWGLGALDYYRKDPFVLDNHLRPQAEFLLPDTRVYPLEQGFVRLREALVADLGVDLVAANFRADPLSPAGTPGFKAADIPYSERLEAAVRDFYAEDFARFDYAD